MNNIINFEQIYSCERDVKYVFIKAERQNKDKLLIVFSAFSPKGNPPVYNYTKTLENIDCNKLFILDDFAPRGSYYISLGTDNSIEISVMKLINKILDENGIYTKNVITIGSSKGGYAALYYAIKYNFGYTIAGSPPVFIGNSLSKTNSYDIIEYLTKEVSLDELNNVLIKQIDNSKKFPKIHLFVGKGEYHYFNHVKYLEKAFEVNRIDYSLDLGDFNSHNDVGRFFPEFLKNTIMRILDSTFIKQIKTNIISIKTGSKLQFEVNARGKDMKYAWYVFKDNEVIEKNWYKSSNLICWEPAEKGKYKIKIFVKDTENQVVSKMTDEIIVI